MSGYKESVINDNPVAFWTFDHDLANASTVFDEMGNQNPLTIYGTDYRLEAPSLNDLEVTDQHSIIFAELGKTQAGWNNTYLSAPHSASFGFSNEYSVEFIVYKDLSEKVREQGQPGYVSDIHSPVIKKGNVIDIKFIDSLYGDDQLFVKCNDLEVSVINNTNVENGEWTVFENTIHVTVTYNTKNIDIGITRAILNVYINGHLIGSDYKDYNTSPPSINVANQIFIGANGGSDIKYDYQSEKLQLDQIAIYDYKLTEEQIARHYKKTKRYKDLIADSFPRHYIRFNDNNHNSNSLSSYIGGSEGIVTGSWTKYQQGPAELLDSHSLYVYNRGSVYFKKLQYSDIYPMLYMDSDYTVEFWFKTNSIKQGVLFMAVSDKPEFNGLTIMMNSKRGEFLQGSIEIIENTDNTISTEEYDPNHYKNYADLKWHHICVTKNGLMLSCYIDGVLVAEKEMQSISISDRQLTTVHIFNSPPGNMPVEGSISELAIYDYGFNHADVFIRSSFRTRHYISGLTLLEGVGQPALIRFYNSLTGDFIGETKSNSNGEYTFYVYSNRFVDILAKIPDNLAVRYRTHGPVKPVPLPDDHLL